MFALHEIEKFSPYGQKPIALDQREESQMTKLGIEVFRDLTIASDRLPLSAIRVSLLGAQGETWSHGAEQEGTLRKYAVGTDREDVLVFIYEGEELPKAAITLWERNQTYCATNIVPAESGQLTVREYNTLLCDFVHSVVDRSDARDELMLDLTDEVRGLNSWTSDQAAEALGRFSTLANKSTTNSHPNDLQRWEEFVILAHQSAENLPVDMLMQWLIEIDGWDERSANKLAINYEQGISLLATYDTALRG